MNPPLIIKGAPLDYELCNLLGEGSADFIVVCADGEQVPFLGTPYDSPATRESYRLIIAGLNDRSAKSQWRELFKNWRPKFIAHYKLPPETTSFDFHPEFSFAISRVCHGYSEHLHAAIGLFDRLGARVKSWRIAQDSTGANVEIVDARDAIYHETGPRMAETIAVAVRRLLKN